MAREIRKSPVAGVAPPPVPNDFKDRLVKLIPSEIITAYVTIFGLLKVAQIPLETNVLLQWLVLSILLIVTPFYLFYIADVKKTAQIIITTIAFVIWVIVVGGPFDTLMTEALASLMGSILLILYTLLIPIFYKG